MADFLKQVNDIFDFMNVRNFRKGKQPLKGDENDLSKIANFRKQVQCWMTKEKNIRQPCFLALLQCLNAMEMMSQDLVQNGIFSYLLTGRINQDCLENLFSQIRVKGGHRFSPSAKEFVYAYRALLTNMLLASIPSGNCVIDGDELLTSLNHMNSKVGNSNRKMEVQDIEVKSNRSKRQKTTDDSEFHPASQPKTEPDEAFVNDNISDFELTSTVTNIVAYIGGYIVRKVDLDCTACIALLTLQVVISRRTEFVYPL